MRRPLLIVADHGILTGLTNPGWPQLFAKFIEIQNAQEDRPVHVITDHYTAGPFPVWNCWVKNPRLAKARANQIRMWIKGHEMDVALVSHSNGGHVHQLVARRLWAEGIRIQSIVQIGSAGSADLDGNGFDEALQGGLLDFAFAYCSHNDPWTKSKVIWPYGNLGTTGWKRGGKTLGTDLQCVTRWFNCGHSGYFHDDQIASTFAQIVEDCGVHSRPAADADSIEDDYADNFFWGMPGSGGGADL